MIQTSTGLTPYAGVLAAIAAALIAAFTSILVAIWAKRTQKFLLTRQSELQSGLNQSIESLRDELERSRSYNVFMRDQIASHLNEALMAYNKISAFTYLVGRRTWTDAGKLSEADIEFYSQMNSLRTHLGVLKERGAITSDLHSNFLGAWGVVEHRWDRLTSELTLRNPDYRLEFPNEREFSPSKYRERFEDFVSAIKEFEEAILPLFANVSVPK